MLHRPTPLLALFDSLSLHEEAMLSAVFQLAAALVALNSRADLAIILRTGGSGEGSCQKVPFCHHSFCHQVPNARQAAAAGVQVLPIRYMMRVPLAAVQSIGGSSCLQQCTKLRVYLA